MVIICGIGAVLEIGCWTTSLLSLSESFVSCSFSLDLLWLEAEGISGRDALESEGLMVVDRTGGLILSWGRSGASSLLSNFVSGNCVEAESCV